MKKLGICGHYAFRRDISNGQTIKTKIITSELEKYYGKNDIEKLDTYGGKIRFAIILLKMIFLIKNCENIIIFPGKNGLRILGPLIVFFNKIYQRNLNYIVIGGWLPEFVEKRNYIKKVLMQFNYIYVETDIMKKKLERFGIKNVVVMPNCKELKILKKEELTFSSIEPLKLCTFSRVSEEKGIEYAINAVQEINKKYNKMVYTLDIFGQVEFEYRQKFRELQKKFPDFIRYKGVIQFSESTNVLKEYYLLLFPTYYSGEGFAGTIIDAYSAGIAVLASDWRYNTEIIKNNKTGLIFKNRNLQDLINKLEECYKNKNLIHSMKNECILEAKKYQTSNVITILLNNLK